MASPIALQQVPQPASAPTNWAPTAKVSAGMLASAVTILIVQFVPHASTWTPVTAGALTQVVTFLVQYMVPERK
jgi:hypothetical protein